eukprot:3898297-Pyramimonas_sp.AAC.1
MQHCADGHMSGLWAGSRLAASQAVYMRCPEGAGARGAGGAAARGEAAGGQPSLGARASQEPRGGLESRSH